MVAKRIIIIALVVVLVAGIGVGAWFLLTRTVSYKGTVENAHTVTITLKDNLFFDVYVPNEAQLMETDEYSIYRYDLLTIAVRESEPETTDFKAYVGGKWIVVESKGKWLAPTLYSFEHNQAYYYNAEYEYTEVWNEETEEYEPYYWNDGPAPYSNDRPTVNEGATIFGIDDYILYKEELLVWKDAVWQMMDRLCLHTSSYIPHYYDDGDVFYAQIGDYVVGCVHYNYNGQFTVLGKGPTGTREALAILTKGLTG